MMIADRGGRRAKPKTESSTVRFFAILFALPFIHLGCQLSLSVVSLNLRQTREVFLYHQAPLSLSMNTSRRSPSRGDGGPVSTYRRQTKQTLSRFLR